MATMESKIPSKAFSVIFSLKSKKAIMLDSITIPTLLIGKITELSKFGKLSDRRIKRSEPKLTMPRTAPPRYVLIEILRSGKVK